MNAKKIIAAAMVVLAVELGVITATVVYIAVKGVTMEVNLTEMDESGEEVAEEVSNE